MRLKAQNFCITISFKYKKYPTGGTTQTSFVIKAADVDNEKAFKIAEILFPDFVIEKVDSVVNDELTLTYDDYVNLHMMVNDKLLGSMKASKTTYDKISHPLDLKYKKLLEKMNARLGLFRGSCGCC